jgi:hypothetical protein
MNENNFERQLESKLRPLNKDQIKAFGFVCTMRGLPFLATNGNFDYLINNGAGKQISLYNIFLALNLIQTDEYNGYDFREGANAWWLERIRNYTAHLSKTEPSVNPAIFAISAILWASNVGGIDGMCNAAKNVAYAAELNMIRRFDNVLLQDIDDIRTKNKETFDAYRVFSNLDTGIYGKIWNNFQSALQRERCNSLWNWFQQIYISGFDYGEIKSFEFLKKIETSLGINNGRNNAADVARYL